MSVIDTGEPVVRITLKTIYDEVLATKQLVAPLPGTAVEHTKELAEHDVRLRDLETAHAVARGHLRALAWVSGALLTIFAGTGGAVLAGVLSHAIK